MFAPVASTCSRISFARTRRAGHAVGVEHSPAPASSASHPASDRQTPSGAPPASVTKEDASQSPPRQTPPPWIPTIPLRRSTTACAASDAQIESSWMTARFFQPPSTRDE